MKKLLQYKVVIKIKRVEINNCIFYIDEKFNIYNKNKKLLKQKEHPRTHYIFVSSRDSESKLHNVLVHRLIAKAFIDENLDNTKEVHHKDRNRGNNSIDNLEVIIPREHRIEHQQIYPMYKSCVVCGKIFEPKSTKRKRAKTCSKECANILIQKGIDSVKRKINQFDKNTNELLKIWESARDIQNTLGFAESNINKCCNYKIKSAYGYIWRYACNEYN